MKVQDIRYTPPPKIPLTSDAIDKAKKKRQQLLQERKETLVRLQAAREMGDLSENGAYKYAKFELGNIGRQLKKLNHLLNNATLISKASSESVQIGHTVTIQSENTEYTYTLVSEHESDPSQKKLSITSPIGKALLNKKVGESVSVNAPKGTRTYKILNIS